MSRDRLPLIGSSGSKTTAKPSLSSPALQRPHQVNQRKRSQQQTSSSAASSTSHPPPGPSTILASDTTMTPWGGLALCESSFASIPPPPAPQAPPRAPPPPPAPQPTPSTPYCGRQNEDEEVSSSSLSSEAPSPPGAVPQDTSGGGGRGLRARRRLIPQHAQRRVPRPPRLPPLRPVTNLSFSRSFTFSFFELPLHQSPRCRAERVRNLLLLLRQIHY